MSGYTALSRSLTPSELSRMINRFEGAVSDAAAAFGGRVVKLAGDGALFSATSAVAACQIADAVAGGAADAPHLPAIRAGVAAGRVLTVGGDVFGPVVNLAARLSAVAPERSVVVDQETRTRVGHALAFERLPDQHLKGFADPSAAFRLLKR